METRKYQILYKYSLKLEVMQIGLKNSSYNIFQVRVLIDVNRVTQYDFFHGFYFPLDLFF